MGEKGWSFSEICGKSLVESGGVELKTIGLVCYGSNSVRYGDKSRKCGQRQC